MAQVCLLTGKPGAGKTTLIRKVVAVAQVNAGGFYTEEIRCGGMRQGFKIITLNGQESVLSHIDIASSFKVGKYVVDIANLERVGVSAIEQAIRNSDLIIIDEIGKMELFSQKFRQTVLTAINSGKKVLGTILLSPHPFADSIKNIPEVQLVKIDREYHISVLEQLLGWLHTIPDENNS